MKAAAIEAALGHHSDKNTSHSYSKALRFDSSVGLIGVVRHYNSYHRGHSEPELWHYHETDGRSHCTRAIKATDIVCIARGER